MNTLVDNITEVEGGCDRPDLSGRLYAYLDDPINEPAADEIEEHLLDCRDCRESFLMSLNLRRAGRQSSIAEDEEVAGTTDVVRIADFRKEYP